MNLRIINDTICRLNDVNDLFLSFVFNNRDHGFVLYNDLRYKVILYSSFKNDVNAFYIEDVFIGKTAFIEIPYNDITNLKRIIISLIDNLEDGIGWKGISNDIGDFELLDELSYFDMEEYLFFIRDNLNK